jgi:hypothetical protein
MICQDIDKCFTGGEISPLNCPRLTIWIDPNLEPPEVPMEEPSVEEPES